MSNDKMKTNKVINYIDKFFVADITNVKTQKDFENILYDVFFYGDDTKKMYILPSVYKEKIKPLLLLITKEHDDNHKYMTEYGSIKPVFHIVNNDKTYKMKNLLIFVDCFDFSI